MKIQQALLKYSHVEIDLLLAFVLKKSKEFLYLHGENRLTRKQTDRLTQMIKRRQKGEPIAYILGYKDFMGLRFKVNRDVLIPRPETEWLVERLNDLRLKALKIAEQPIRILDVGTGSGCISVSLAKQFKIFNLKFKITASDISSRALKVAKTNSRLHKVNIKFVKSDLLKNIKGSFDIIIANLPYVPETDYRALIPGLRFEPKSAIFAKEKGLEIIRKFLQQLSAPTQKVRGSDQRVGVINYKLSVIYLEFDPRQKTSLHQLIKKYLPNWQVKFYKDFNNMWRHAEVIQPEVF